MADSGFLCRFSTFFSSSSSHCAHGNGGNGGRKSWIRITFSSSYFPGRNQFGDGLFSFGLADSTYLLGLFFMRHVAAHLHYFFLLLFFFTLLGLNISFISHDLLYCFCMRIFFVFNAIVWVIVRIFCSKKVLWLSKLILSSLAYQINFWFYRKNEYPKKAPRFYEVTYNSKERPDVWVDSPDKLSALHTLDSVTECWCI